MFTIVQELIDAKHCFNPKQMTVDDLRMELGDRGLDSNGNRDELVQRLTKQDNSTYSVIT
jgi:hypothetical protein